MGCIKAGEQIEFSVISEEMGAGRLERKLDVVWPVSKWVMMGPVKKRVSVGLIRLGCGGRFGQYVIEIEHFFFMMGTIHVC